jgi:cell division protein FtsL
MEGERAEGERKEVKKERMRMDRVTKIIVLVLAVATALFIFFEQGGKLW